MLWAETSRKDGRILSICDTIVLFSYLVFLVIMSGVVYEMQH